MLESGVLKFTWTFQTYLRWNLPVFGVINPHEMAVISDIYCFLCFMRIIKFWSLWVLIFTRQVYCGIWCYCSLPQWRRASQKGTLWTLFQRMSLTSSHRNPAICLDTMMWGRDSVRNVWRESVRPNSFTYQVKFCLVYTLVVMNECVIYEYNFCFIANHWLKSQKFNNCNFQTTLK